MEKVPEKRFRIVHRINAAVVETHGMIIEEALAVLGVTHDDVWWVGIRGKFSGCCVIYYFGAWLVPMCWDALGPGRVVSSYDQRGG